MSLKAGYKGIRSKFVDFINGKLLSTGISGKITSDNISLGNGMTTDTNKKLVVNHGIIGYYSKEDTVATASTAPFEITVPSTITLTNRILSVSLESSSNACYVRNWKVDNTTHKITVYVTTTSAEVTAKVHVFIHY